jgi:hypothetical protein
MLHTGKKALTGGGTRYMVHVGVFPAGVPQHLERDISLPGWGCYLELIIGRTDILIALRPLLGDSDKCVSDLAACGGRTGRCIRSAYPVNIEPS